MFIFIESYLGDRLISGKKCTEKELREKFMKAVKAMKTEDFTNFFCRMFQFNEIPMDKDVQVDFMIDLDTHLVYKPQY
jgi:hypothetical protein